MDIVSGDVRWHYARTDRCKERECVYVLSAALIACNDIVVAGSIDGHLDIVHAETGERLWTHDVWQSYESVNGRPTQGGGLDAHGAMLADDLLLVSAGYAYVGQQRPGNAFLVFQLGNDTE